jgi:hypothetical protein
VTDLPPLDAPLRAPPFAEPQAAPRVSWASGWKLGIAAGGLLAAGMLGIRVLNHSGEPGDAAAPVQLTAPSAVPAAALAVNSPPAAAVVATAPAPRATASTRNARIGASLAPVPAQLGARSMPRSRERAATEEPGSSLELEVQLLGSANELIRAQRFDAAMRVLASHTRRFPHGALREEREALRALALCGLGSDERAQRAVRRFLDSSPHSVVAERVRTSCTTSGLP